MNDIKVSINKLTNSSKKVLHYLSKHQVVLIFIIASVAIIVALLQTRSYLDPVKNEDLYTELSAEINYQGIDEDVLVKLQSTQSDEEIQVDSNFVPDRNNPFNE